MLTLPSELTKYSRTVFYVVVPAMAQRSDGTDKFTYLMHMLTYVINISARTVSNLQT